MNVCKEKVNKRQKKKYIIKCQVSLLNFDEYENTTVTNCCCWFWLTL